MIVAVLICALILCIMKLVSLWREARFIDREYRKSILREIRELDRELKELKR